MTEKAEARDYLLECVDPEVLQHPEHLLNLRRSWRAGTYQVRVEVQEMDPDDIVALTEDDFIFDLGEEPVPRDRVPHTETAVSGGFKRFVVVYFAIVLLRALYKSMSGDDS